MNQQVRFVLFIALSVAILVGWQALVGPRSEPRSPAAGASQADAGAPAAIAPAPEPAAPTAEPPSPAPAAPEEVEAPAETVQVETELWTAAFTSRGAALTAFELKGDKQRRHVDGKTVPVELAAPLEGGATRQLAASVGVGGAFETATWRIVERGERVLAFERRAGGLLVRKSYRWAPDSYVVQLTIDVTRETGERAAVPLRLGLQLPSAIAIDGEKHRLHHAGGGSMFGGQPALSNAACHLAGEGRSVDRLAIQDEKATNAPQGLAGWAAVEDHYFLVAAAPTVGANARCTQESSARGVQAELAVDVDPAPGAAASAAFDVYLGPKDVRRLEAADHDFAISVNFGYGGFFDSIAKLLLVILRLFEGFVGNWGVAIILLTILMKALTFPLTQKQMKSMEEMKRLAPKIEELKAKYAGDQNKINLETMQLYKEHNVQPLGGCLPMLVQMPVWFALYAALANSFELYNEAFIPGWISDLTAHDPFYVLPVLMTVTMVLTQALTPQAQPNPQMKYMMYGMPIFFGFIMLSLPAGLVLYIFTNNLLSIAQSLWFRRTHGAV